MKETKSWLRIAEKKAQSELTFLRQQIRALDAFQSINHLSEITQQRRIISAAIKIARREFRNEKYKAVLRGDLSPEKYRPSPPRKNEPSEIITLEPVTTTEQRELLLVS